MSIRAIHAIFECDGCGCEFATDIEVAGTRPLRWSMLDIANEALRHGNGWVHHQRQRSVGPVSYQRGKQLCPQCTREEDDRHHAACVNDECDGCKPMVDTANDDISDRAYGRAVAAHVVEKAGLRREGESVTEYALRAGIQMRQPMPSKPASFDDYLGDAS